MGKPFPASQLPDPKDGDTQTETHECLHRSVRPEFNSKGLRVILKACRAINAQGGRVVLMNFQPHIKEVFEIINALPEQRIFANWHAFTNYLGAVQNGCVDAGCLKQSEIGADNSIICAAINTHQRNEMHPL